MEKLIVENFPDLSILLDNWKIIQLECSNIKRKETLSIDREGKTHEQVAQEILNTDRMGWVESWGPMKKLWLNYVFCFGGGVHGVMRIVQKQLCC